MDKFKYIIGVESIQCFYKSLIYEKRSGGHIFRKNLKIPKIYYHCIQIGEQPGKNLSLDFSGFR